MTTEDRQAYAAQYEVALKRVPRGRLINHVIWRDGQLTFMHGPMPRVVDQSDVTVGSRGVQSELFQA